MHTLLNVTLVTFALAGTALAGPLDNVALSSLGASVYAVNGELWDNVAINAIDDNLGTEWVAPGGTVGPYLLVNLGKLFSVDFITIDGVGNPGLTTSFSVFVGTLPDLLDIANGGPTNLAPVLAVLDQPDGLAWSQTGAVSPATQIQYVLYVATNSTTGCPVSPCYPGNAHFVNGVPISGQDDAFMTAMIVDDPAPPVPEPATFGLIGLTVLAMGFYRLRQTRAMRN